MTAIMPENTQEAPKTQEEAQAVKLENKIDTNAQQAPSQDSKSGEENGDPNWRAFREARKKDRAEKEAAERRAIEKEAEVAALKAAMEAAFQKEAQQKSYSRAVEPQYEQEESEEDRISKAVDKKLAEREAQREREQMEREYQEFPQRLAREYVDFNQVCSTENVDYLDYHFPEIAKPLSMLPEGYQKWAYIYQNVKKFVPNANSAKRDAQKAQENLMKPKSMSTTSGMSPNEVGGSSRISEEKLAANWQRMQRTLKGVS